MNGLEEKPRTAAVEPKAKPQAAPKAPARERSNPFDFEDDAPKGFRKYRSQLIVGIIAVAGIVGAYFALSGAQNNPAPKAQEVQEVRIAPLNTPPPPPPPPQPQEQPKDEPKMVEAEQPQEEEPEAAAAPAIETANKGAGTGNSLGLARGNSSGIFGGSRNKQTAKMRWDAWGGAVGRQIEAAMKSHPLVRKAVFKDLKARIWFDAAGAVSRVTISPSTGNSALDAAIRDEVIGRYRASEVMPEGMPSPLVIKLNGRRPN